MPISQLIIKGTYDQDYTIDHTGRQKAAASGSTAESGATSPPEVREAPRPPPEKATDAIAPLPCKAG